MPIPIRAGTSYYIPQMLWDAIICLWTSCLFVDTACLTPEMDTYRQVSNISRTLDGNKIVDHSDVVGASPVGAAPTTSSFST